MQGFNRYYPPDYDPKDKSHKGNLNRLAGKAAQKPVIRFEMPYNVWCLHCDSHIAQGVRFNAEKSKTGNFLSSPIFSFTMKCHICTGIIVIATNPKETCYDVLEGAKKKAEEWNAIENGTFEMRERDVTKEDPIYKLEQDATQRLNIKDARSRASALLDLNERQWSDPFSQSQRLRSGFRREKQKLTLAENARQEIADRHGLAIDLLEPSVNDSIQAKLIDFVVVSQNGLNAQKPLERLSKRPSNQIEQPKSVFGKARLRTDPFTLPLPTKKRFSKPRLSHVPATTQGANEVAARPITALVGYNSDGED